MNKRRRVCYVGLILSGLLVAVLYSPIGSPELYSRSSDTVVTAAVVFGKLQKRSVSENSNEDMPEMKPDEDTLHAKTAARAGVQGYAMASSGMHETVNAGANPIGGTVAVAHGAVSEGSSTVWLALARGSASRSAVAAVEIGVSATSLTENPNNGKARSVAASTTTISLADPGADDTPGPPIPLSDAVLTLCMCCLVYTCFVFLKAKKALLK